MISIVNTSGAVIASYEYDPYGSDISATGDLAEVNPLRYRGYVYDTETKMYYLQSRYYDPRMGRFINADAYTSTGQGILGNNMFAYCGNNPVNFSDPFGYFKKKFTPIYADNGFDYILNQHDESIASLPLGESTVGSMGRALVAIYNALLMLGDYTSFEDIYAYFTIGGRLSDNGKSGVNIAEVIKYLKTKGYDIFVHTSILPYEMNQGSRLADACIMLYRYYKVKNDKISFNGHFVAYRAYEDGFVGYNTSEVGGITQFSHAAVYGLNENRYFTYVICITNP